MPLPNVSAVTSGPDHANASESWLPNLRQRVSDTGRLLTSTFSRLLQPATNSNHRTAQTTSEQLHRTDEANNRANSNSDDSLFIDNDENDLADKSTGNSNQRDVPNVTDTDDAEAKKSADLESGQGHLKPRLSSCSTSSSFGFKDPISRFEYDPQSFLERLMVSIRVKNKLDSSRIIRIRFNNIYKYLLLVILLLLTFFLTPNLLPRWLGFEWARPQDLCQSPDAKLRIVEQLVRNESRFDRSLTFIRTQRHLFSCMNDSAVAFYMRPLRFQWPHECTSEIAQTSLHETECHKQETNVCSAVGGFFGFLASIGGNCVRETGPEVCTNTTDQGRADTLLALEQARARSDLLTEGAALANATSGDDDARNQGEDMANAANGRMQLIVSRIMQQIDVAADAFIIYSFLAIAVGVPLIIYRREKGSLVVNTTFGLTKMSFVLVFVIALSLIDSATMVARETDFGHLLRAFMQDPCFVDPRFARRRIEIISHVCSQLRAIERENAALTERMDMMYYDIRLFGYCKDDNRPLAPHPGLPDMNATRLHFRNGSGPGFNPGVCNMTRLDDLTSSPQNLGEAQTHRWRSLLGSGVIAQLLLKFVLTSWIIHLFAYIHPMVLHNGKVEIWGPVANDNRLPRAEENAVMRFSRDKHLLSLLVFSVLMLIEIGLIMYAVIATAVGADHVEEQAQNIPSPVMNSPITNMECPASFLA